MPYKLFIKSLLTIIIFFFLSSSSYSFLLKRTPALFGIELDAKVDKYGLKECYNTRDVRGQLNDQGNLSVEHAKMPNKNWKEYYYTESKLPVLEGCVRPLESNDDFFNYKIHIYPESKKVYAVSAVHAKPIRDFNECGKKIAVFMQAIIDTNKKKGFKYNKGYQPGVALSFNKSDDVSTYMKKGFDKIRIRSLCSNYGSLHINEYNMSAFDNTLPNVDGLFFIVVSLSNFNSSTFDEEMILVKENILTDELKDKSGL